VVLTTLPQNLLEILDANSYDKGSWILHMLRREMGEEAFWNGIRLYYKTYQNSNADTEDFRKIMGSAAKVDLKQFFNQWLYTAGHPIIDIKWSFDQKSNKITGELHQQQKAIFTFPLEIGVYNKEGRLERIETVKITQKTQKIEFSTPMKPLKIELDPNVNLLFEGKTTYGF
jgi:aminopeptidase N